MLSVENRNEPPYNKDSGQAPDKVWAKKDSLTPIFSVISDYSNKNIASFHTPGHKGHAGLLEGIRTLKHDLTELPATFDLFDNNSASVISLSEKLAANAFGAYDSFYSATGCTPCIQTMVFIAAKNCGLFKGKKLLCARNAHKSLVNVCGLLDLEVIWVYGDEDDKLGGGQISPAEIRAALKKHGGDIGAVYITTPDYYGRIADVAAISKLCDDAGLPLLVDNAHGSHLGAFDVHPITLGASATADSLHKTLPVLTGGAVLHVSQKAYDSFGFKREYIKPAMERFSSSSPPFNILSSIDLARDWWKRVGNEIYKLTGESVEKIRKAAQAAGVIFLETSANSRFGHDPTRVVIHSAEMGIAGSQVADFLREYSCEAEFFDDDFCVLIVTPFNTPDELYLLEEALIAFGIANKRGRFWRKRKAKKEEDFLENPFIRPLQKMSIKKAMISKSITVHVSNAKGKISANTVCTCPPGIPIVVPGEDISEYAAGLMEKSGFTHIEVVD